MKFAQFFSDKTNRILSKMKVGIGGMLANNLFDWGIHCAMRNL